MFVSSGLFPSGKGMGPTLEISCSYKKDLILRFYGRFRSNGGPQLRKIREYAGPIPQSRWQIPQKGIGRTRWIEVFEGTIGRHQVQVVGLGQFLGEPLGQGLSPGKTMWLEDHLQGMIGKKNSSLAEKGTYLSWVMRVVLNDTPCRSLVQDRLPAIHSWKKGEVDT
tara:strand:+ start:192 stop:689 length:498 start_codon:yes stop_codon:yes gene_type:complete